MSFPIRRSFTRKASRRIPKVSGRPQNGKVPRISRAATTTSAHSGDISLTVIDGLFVSLLLSVSSKQTAAASCRLNSMI